MKLGFNTIMLQETRSRNKRPAAERRVQTTSSRNNTIMLQETCLINIKKKPQETRLQAASIKKIMNLTTGPLLGYKQHQKTHEPDYKQQLRH